MPLEYLAHGHAVASINYRLSRHARFPAQLEDCKAEVPVTLYTVKGAGHGGFRGPKVSELTREFLATHLRPSDSKPR